MSRTNDNIDDGWLCDRGRWGLDSVNSPERLRAPLIRKRRRACRRRPGTRRLTLVAHAPARDRQAAMAPQRCRRHRLDPYDERRERISSRSCCARAWAPTTSITSTDASRCRAVTACPGPGPTRIAGLERASHIVLLGADPYTRQPIVDLRIRKAMRGGAQVYVLSPEPNRLDRLAARCHPLCAQARRARWRGALLQVVLAEKLHARRLRAGACERASGAGSQPPGCVPHLEAGGRRRGGSARAGARDRAARKAR